MLNKIIDTVTFVILTILEGVAMMLTISSPVWVMDTAGFMYYAIDVMVFVTLTTGIYFATALKFIENNG